MTVGPGGYKCIQVKRFSYFLLVFLAFELNSLSDFDLEIKRLQEFLNEYLIYVVILVLNQYILELIKNQSQDSSRNMHSDLGAPDF